MPTKYPWDTTAPTQVQTKSNTVYPWDAQPSKPIADQPQAAVVTSKPKIGRDLDWGGDSSTDTVKSKQRAALTGVTTNRGTPVSFVPAKLQKNSQTAGAFTAGLSDAASLGLIPKAIKYFSGDNESVDKAYGQAQKSNPIAYGAGQGYGYLMGGTKIAGSKPVQAVVGKVGNKLGKQVVEGALTGAGMTAIEDTVKGKGLKQTAKDVAMNMALGAGIDLGLHGAGKLVQGIIKKYGDKALTPQEVKAVREEVKNVLYADPYGNIRKTPQTDLLLPAAKENIEVPKLKQVESPFKITPAEKTRIEGVQSPEINQRINTETMDKKSILEPSIKLQGIAPQVAENIDTARAKINYTPAKKSKFSNLWQRTRAQLTDRYAPIEDLEKKVRGGLASAESSPYKQARLYEGTPEKANLIIQTELKPIIQGIESKGHDYKDLGLYAEAVHAKDVNAAGMVSGFTDAEIDDVIKKLGTPEMEAARKKLMEYSDNRLQTLLKNPITGEDGNIITLESYNKLKQKWPNYMPLNRHFDDDKVEFVNGIAKSFSNVGTPIDRLQGSKRDIIDPIESMIKNTFRIESAAGRNKVGLQLSQLANEDVAQRFIRKLNDDEIVGRKNVISVIENGNKVKYEVEPEVYKAMKNMDDKVNSVLIKVLQAPASVLRAGATLTPDFSFRNPIRDVFNAFIVSKSGFNPFTDFASGLASYIKKGELYQEFIKNNGGYGNIISMDRNVHRQALESMLKKSPSEKFVNVINPKSWVGLMRTISDATESATKIGEFRAALRKGANPQEAAYRARDLMDFARAGTSVKELNKVTAFLNANIQGKSKFIRAIKEDPKGVTTRLFYTMAAPSLGAYAANYYFANDKQKATIKDAPDWLRDSFWLVAIPGTDMVARIPKPFDASVVSNSIERMLDYTIGKDPDAFDGFIKSTIKEQSIPVMLTGLAPMIEGMTNYSFFRDAPIIPLREQYLQPKDQYDIYTSEVSKTIAAAVRAIAGNETNFASPRIIENSIRGMTAGLGGYALDTVDKIAGKEKPAKNTSQLPVVKAFTVNEFSTGKSMNFVYDEKDRLTKEKNSLKLSKLPFTKQRQLDYLETVAKQIGDISSEIRKVQNSNNLTAIEKRDKINVLSEKRNNITRAAQEQYKSRKW